MGSWNANVWCAITIGSAALAVIALLVTIMGSNRGLFYVFWGRYLDYLTLLLRRLRIFKPPHRIATMQAALLLVVLGFAALGLCPFWHVLSFVIAFGPAFVLERRVKKRVIAIDNTADAYCLALANSLKTTASVGAAVETASSLLHGPVAEEMEHAVKETRVGRSLNDALQAVGPRAKSHKLGIVLAALLIGRQVGGNLTRVLETTAATLREMERLEGVVRQKTADARMQIWGLVLAPLLICAGIYKLDPTYFQPLTTSTLGFVISGAATVSYVLGLLLARKILAVDI